jgi:tight adherence protein B
MGLVWLSFAAAAVCLVTAALQFGGAAARQEQATRRLATTTAREAPGLLHDMDERLERLAPVRAVQSKLLAAGVETRAVNFLAWCASGMILGAVLLSSLGSPTLAVVLVALTALGVRLWLNRRVEQRREQLITQLPDLARLLSNAANAGLAMRTGIAMAAREIAEPARSELLHVTELLAVGYPLDEALAAMSRRLPSREVSVLVTTLVVQQRSGGRVITALRNVASTLEIRKDVRREIRTLMAGAISSAYIVAGLGLGSVVMVNLVSPGVFDSMVASPIGRLVFVFSTTLYVVGFTVIRRMTRIEP